MSSAVAELMVFLQAIPQSIDKHRQLMASVLADQRLTELQQRGGAWLAGLNNCSSGLAQRSPDCRYQTPEFTCCCRFSSFHVAGWPTQVASPCGKVFSLVGTGTMTKGWMGLNPEKLKKKKHLWMECFTLKLAAVWEWPTGLIIPWQEWKLMSTKTYHLTLLQFILRRRKGKLFPYQQH